MLNLGSLQFTLGVNTRALDAARQRIESFGRVVEQTQARANRGAETPINALRRQENTILKSMELLNKLTRQIQSSNLTPQVKLDMITQLNREFNNMSKTMANAAKTGNATAIDRNFAVFKNTVADINSKLTQTVAAEQAVAKASAGAEAGWLRQENAIARNVERARQLINTIENSKLAPQVKTGMTDRIESSMSSMKSGLGGGLLDARGMSTVSNEYTASLNKIRREFATAKTEMRLGSAAKQDWVELYTQLKSLGSVMLLINGHLGGMSTRFLALSAVVHNYGVAVGLTAGALTALGVGLHFVATTALTSTMALERTSKTLTAITGNTQTAAFEMDHIRQTSDMAGTSFKETSDAYARYLAASQASGQSLSQTRQQFQEIAMAAGTLSLTVEDTQGVFKALEQMLSKGKVQAEELRGQLGDRLPGAFAIAADAMHMTTAELSDAMKKGEVYSKDFVPKFTAALVKAFNIDMSKPIDTIQASMNRLQTAIDFFNSKLAESTNLSAAAKAIYGGMAEVLNYLANNMEGLIRTLVGLTGAMVGAAAGYYAIAAAQAAWIAGSAVIAWITSVIGLIRTATTVTELWTVAQIALNTAMMTNPIGAVISLILRIGLAIGGAILGYNLLTGAVDRSARAMQNTASIDGYIAAQKALGTQIRATTADYIKQQKVMTAGLVQEADALKQRINDAQARVTQAQDYSAKVQGIGKAGAANMIKTARQELAALYPEYKDMMDKLDHAQKNSAELQKILSMPERLPGGGGSGEVNTPGGSKKDRTDQGDTDLKNMIDNIREAMGEATSLQAQLDALAAGTSFDDLFRVENLEKAKVALRNMDDKQLLVIKETLKALGFDGQTAAEALAHLWDQIEGKGRKLDAFKQVDEAIKGAASAVRQNNIKIEALKVGTTDSDVDRIVAKATALDDMAESLRRSGVSGEEAAKKLAEYGVALDKVAESDKALEMQESIRKMQDDIADSMAKNLTMIIRDFHDIKAAAKNLVNDLINIFMDEAITKPLQDMFRNLLRTGSTGGSGGFFGSLIEGVTSMFAFADGGNPPVGKASIVGERGPELFVPKTSGTIIPNDEIGGGSGAGTSLHVTINAPGATGETIMMIRREIASAAPSLIQAAQQSTMKTLTRKRLGG